MIGQGVTAVAPGRVVSVGPLGTYGLTVIIQHGGGDYSIYGSLARADVRKGSGVTKGETIGAVGADDPHPAPAPQPPPAAHPRAPHAGAASCVACPSPRPLPRAGSPASFSALRHA